MKKRYRRGVFVVIYQKQKDKLVYLLLKRKLHWKGWEFNKGGVKALESENKAILREIKEETGQTPYNIIKYNKKGKFQYNLSLKDRPGLIGQTYSLYSAQLKNKKIKKDKNEHSAYKWVSFQQAIKLITYSNQRACLRLVNKKLTQ